MQKQYKEEMQKISLSDSDRARILANVKKAYEESNAVKNPDDKVVPIQSRPRFSARRMGMVAAACVVLVAGALVISGQYFWNGQPGNVDNPVVIANNDVEVWEELASVDDIAKQTDCKTYTLSNVSKSYKVKKVEVKKKQKHVKISYHSRKHKEDILLEYKEAENAPEVTEQFADQKEFTTEKVGDKEVTMYGDGECDGMTWQQESCTFAVKMSKSCSKAKAAKLVSGTKERKADDRDKGNEDKLAKKAISDKALGWDGSEHESSSEERRDVLQKIFDMYGFRVLIEEPAHKVAYKVVKDMESFSFEYSGMEEIEDRRIIGYAGRDGSPVGILDDFTEADTLSIDGITIHTYVNDEQEEIYTFTKEDVNFTILVGNVEVEDKSTMLSGLLSVIHVSLEKENVEENEPGEEPKETDDDAEDALVAGYQQAAQEIQYAVADGNLKNLSEYIQFPLKIKGLDIMVASAKEFQSLDESTIFTSTFVNRIASYDPNKIRSNARTITMGSGSNFLMCKVKNKSLLITEMAIEGAKTDSAPGEPEQPEEPTETEEPTPLEE